MTDPARLAVVVCTRDRADQLAETLHALRAVLDSAVDVLVVDSASAGTETQQVAESAGVHVIRAPRPGLSVARNVGIAATTTELIAFTDDDCSPRAGWADSILASFGDDRIGFVTGRLVGVEGGHQVSADHGDRPLTFDSHADPALLGAGASMAFRRTAITAIGGFDEALGAGSGLRSAEDHDAMWRALEAGWLGRYEPSAVVLHREWRGPWDVVRLQWASGLGAGALAMKMARVAPARGWPLLRHRVGRDGMGRAARALAKGWQRAALGSALYAAGAAAGAARTWRRPLTHGLYEPGRLEHE